MRRSVPLALCCCLLLSLVILPAVGQPVGAGEPTGMLQGAVKLADGTPIAGTPVTVQVGEQRLTFTTRNDGAFSGTVPAGEAVISACGQTVKLAVEVGAILPVAITVPLAGALVTATAPDGTPADVPLRAAFRAPDDAREVTGIRLGPGRYLFPEVPAEASALSVIADRKYPQSDCRREWTFTDVRPLREVSITVAGDAPLIVTMVDELGRPIANAPVRGTVRLQIWSEVFWNEDGVKQTGQWSDRSITARTDATGQVTLGVFSANSDLELTLEAGGKSGLTVKGEITADGTATVTRYTAAWVVRRVTQTVFDAEGKPAPNAQVFATYCWHTEGKLLHAVSDAKGRVVWEGLPATRVTVWGPNVPAVFIPRDATEVTGPLPEAAPTGRRYVDFILDLPVNTPVVTRWLMSPGPNHEPCVFHMSRFDPKDVKVPTPRNGGTFTSGRKTNVLAIVETIPPQIAYLRDAYLPAPERDERYSIHLPTMPCAVLHGRFVTPDGKPVPGVSRLGIQLLQCGNPPPDFAFSEKNNMPLLATLLPRERPGGRFDLILPAPGTYQLLVDAYDESVPAPPALILKVEPGERDITVTLPAPLVTVPAGARVRWLTKKEPKMERALTIAAHAPEMPFFAPESEVTWLTCNTGDGHLTLEQDKKTFISIAGVVADFDMTPAYEDDPVLVDLRFTLPDGKPAPAVRCLEVYDAEGRRVYDVVRHLHPVRSRSREQIGLALPKEGTYRLLIDAYDAHVPPLPQFIIRVKKGRQALTIPLPPPLLSVPPGVEVCWLHSASPLEPCSATVPTGKEPLPFFGPREGLLALWYQPKPGEMVLWNGQTRAVSRLPLRSVWLNPNDSEPNDFEGFRVTPLLPGAEGLSEFRVNTGLRGNARSDLTLYGGTPVRCDMWAGSYAVFQMNPPRFCTTFTIPPDGPPEIDIPFDWRSFVSHRIDYVHNNGKLIFPPGDYGAWRKLENQPLAYFDTGDVFSLDWRPGQPTGEVYNIPLAAHAFSLQWVGVGVMRNVPLAKEITLPPWSPGCTVTGTLLDEKGKPAPGAALIVNASPSGRFFDWPPGSLKVTTDAQGRFTVKGLLPGWFYARPEKTGGAWWAFPLPGAPLTKVTLAPGDRVTRCTSGSPYNFNSCYWIPRNGAPLPLPKDGSGFSCRNLPPGPGILWGIEVTGASRLAKYENPPAEVVLGKLPAGGPPLGIALPFDPPRGFPDRFRLTGTGARRGLQAGGGARWQYVPQLGLIVTQLDAVPPGDYTLTVETTAGVVEKAVTVTEYGGGAVYLDLPR